MTNMYTIENKQLKLTLSAKGAELQSLFGKFAGLEYLWNGDPAFWPKHSPLLFPIVGTLKQNSYFFNDKSYQLGRHGFARDMEFEVESLHEDSIHFLLRDNEASHLQFPFAFELRLIYRIQGKRLALSYQVLNTGHTPMYFSIGGHPAFKVPLVGGTSYEDYYLEFNEEETKPRWPVSPEGLIEKKPEPLLRATDKLPLSKSLFAKDALVLKFPTSSIVSLKSDKTEHGLDFEFSGFPYLGLWAAPNADFLCIEPWCGIADSVDSDQQLIHKEGINELAPGGKFEKTWRVALF